MEDAGGGVDRHSEKSGDRPLPILNLILSKYSILACLLVVVFFSSASSINAEDTLEDALAAFGEQRYKEAFDEFSRLAHGENKYHPRIMLSIMHLFGLGTPVNISISEQLNSKLRIQATHRATANLISLATKFPSLQQFVSAYASANGLGYTTDIDSAIQILTISATRNHLLSQLYLGYVLLDEKRYVEARHWFETAFDPPNEIAFNFLSQLDTKALISRSLSGISNLTLAEFLKAQRTRRQASRHKFDSAFQLLARGDRSRAFTQFHKLSEKGYPAAIFIIGQMRIFGIGVSKDVVKGKEQIGKAKAIGRPIDIQYIRNSAINGNGYALLFLSIAYKEGVMVQSDVSVGQQMLFDSADQKNLLALYELGKRYRRDKKDNVGLPLLERAANAGEINSMLALGKVYIWRKSKKEQAKGIKYLRLAAEHGSTDAMYSLGIYHDIGWLQKDYSRAFSWYLKASKKGSRSALGAIGNLYRIGGKNFPRNYTKAMSWYNRGAESGDSGSFYGLGIMYLNGLGAKKDVDKAIVNLEKSAQMGDTFAQGLLASGFYDGSEGLPLDYSKALTWNRKRAKAGESTSQFRLGAMYYFGYGVPVDLYASEFWTRKSANSGYSTAQFNLGIMLQYGKGVTKDPEEAARWYRKAAEKENISAQVELAGLYDRGEGVEKDVQKAVKWYKKAASQGNKDASNILGLKYEAGKGLIQNYSEALRYFSASANGNHKYAQYNLGRMYRDGKGVAVDLVSAHMWFNLAAANGHDSAGSYRDIVARKMTVEQITTAQNRASVWKPDSGPPSRRTVTKPPSGKRKARNLFADLIPKPENKQTVVSSGSGFIATRAGHVLTNAHVIKGCTGLRTFVGRKPKKLSVLKSDTRNDLALLKLPGEARNFGRFRVGRGLRAGDRVVVVGFPLSGLLASESNVTTGTVSALAGPGDDSRLLQITAPVQAGNSGGPLLDDRGTISGIVVSKLDAVRVALVTGDFPQNVNFAIKASFLRSFLEANGVNYLTRGSKKSRSNARIAAEAKKYTLKIECLK